jgi:dolichol-phosphate mannosyltransferase
VELPTGNALVIIPTYNERDNLPALTEEILAQDDRLSVLVVDDGSPDGTGEVAQELAAASDRIDLIERGSKQGLGTAYLDGFQYALEHGFELVFERSDRRKLADEAIAPVVSGKPLCPCGYRPSLQ